MKSIFLSLFLLAAPFGAGAQPILTQPKTPISGLPNTGAERVQLRWGDAILDDEKFNPAKPPSIDGPPGLYTLRFTRGDKARTPVGNEVQVQIPGVLKTPGQWLFNGSLFVPMAPAGIQTESDAPKFLLNLRPNSKAKPPIFALTPQVQQWATVRISANNAPFIRQKPASGFFVGYEWTPNAKTTLDDLRAVRARIEAASPGAPLILSFSLGFGPDDEATLIDKFAPLCDAVHLQILNSQQDLPYVFWPLKVARRVAEERENYDLPIFVSLDSGTWTPALAAEMFASGATGLIGEKPAGFDFYERQINWLQNAVTLEDAAIYSGSPNALFLANQLRAAGRIPLLGRTPGFGKGNPEPILAILNDKTTEADLEGFRRAADAGQTVYLEGLPPLATWEKFGKWASLKITALPVPKTDVLALDDPWLWGLSNAKEYGVTQRVSVSIIESLAGKMRDEKGVARETKPRSVAFLTGDPNGILLAPVGKGRIFWAPHAFVRADLKPEFYGAITGAMQPALVSLEGANFQNLRIAMRQTPAGTPIFWAFNEGTSAQNLKVNARALSDFVLDLKTGAKIPNTQRGFTASFPVTVAPGDWGAWALFKDAETATKERAAAPFKARLQ